MARVSGLDARDPYPEMGIQVRVVLQGEKMVFLLGKSCVRCLGPLGLASSGQ